MCYNEGMDDPERARLNREMVKNKQCIEGYTQVESYLMSHPFTDKLPSWITTNGLVYLSEKDIKQLLLDDRKLLDDDD